MMQNGINESFWDGLGVEIVPCANFEYFAGSAKNDGIDPLGKWRPPRLHIVGIPGVNSELIYVWGEIPALKM